MLLLRPVNVFLANGIGLVVGSLISFGLNRKFTPSFAQNAVLSPFLVYLGLGAGVYLVSSALFVALESMGELSNVTLNFAKLIAIGSLFILKFFMSRWLVFGENVR